MGKINNILYRILVLALLILMCFIEYHSVFNISGTNLNAIVIIIGIFIFALTLIKIKNYIAKLSKKTKRILVFSICLLSFIGMTIFGYSFKSMPGNDLSAIINEKNIMQENGGKFETESYFGMYPYQMPITILVYIFSQIGKLLGIQDFMIVINSLFMTITGYFIYLTVANIKEEDSAVTTLLFYALNPILYLYASYYYTDTICFPFAIISIYLYIKSIRTQKNKLKYLYLILAGIMIIFGYKIRAIVGIILIGILIENFLTKKMFKEKIKTLIFLLLGCLLGITLSILITNPFKPINNKNLEFPVTHWIMMGTNLEESASFNTKDYQYTKNAGNYNEKLKANITKIKENVSNLGPSGIVNLLKLKLKRVWSNGGYDYEYKLYNLEKINGFYEYVLGNQKIFLTYILQIFKVFLYLMFIVAIIYEIKQPGKMKFLFISVFGFILFYIFWESLPRYSLSCMPWIMLIFPKGLEITEKILNKFRSKFYIQKYTKYFCIITLIISIAILIIGFKNYCIIQYTCYDEITMQQNPRGTIKDISNKVVEQEFVTSKKFNTLKLKFMKDNELEGQPCIFNLEILNDKGEILNRQQFSDNSVQNGKFKTFSFDYIIPNGEEKYIIKIYRENQNIEKNSSIEICKYENNEIRTYDAYPQGSLKINNEVQYKQDIIFKIENENVRSKLPKGVYIIISILIVFLELYIFFPYFKKEKI